MLTMPSQTDIMIYDDERSCLESLSGMLEKVYQVHNVKTEDNIFSLRFDLAINRPKLLILDYQYEGNLNLTYAMSTLEKFKGICIIYSSFERSDIEKELGSLPHNFHFVQKGNIGGLKKLLDRFIPICRSNTKEADFLIN